MDRGPIYMFIISSVMLSPVVCLTGYFCPLNGSLPVCDEKFEMSSVSSYFSSLDSFINLNGLMESRQNVTLFCNDLDSYRDLLICARPAMDTCKPEKIRQLDLVPDIDRLMSAVQFLCDQHLDLTCKGGMLSGVGSAISLCLAQVTKDSASAGQLLNMSTDADIITRYCSLYDHTSSCFRPAQLMCGEMFSDVFSRLRQGARPPGCDARSSTSPSISKSASTKSSTFPSSISITTSSLSASSTRSSASTERILYLRFLGFAIIIAEIIRHVAQC